jgi:hypothetical protein
MARHYNGIGAALAAQKSWSPLGTAEPFGESGGISGRTEIHRYSNNSIRGAAVVEMIGTYPSIIQPNSHVRHHTCKFIHRRIDVYDLHLSV